MNGYKEKVIGKDLVIEIMKQCNMCTKKWTIARLKKYNKLINEAFKDCVLRKKNKK